MKTKQLITPKFQIGDIMGIAFTLGVTAIGIAYMLNVMGETRDEMCTYGDDGNGGCLNSTGGVANQAGDYPTEYNATADGITAIAKFPTKLGLIVTVVIAAIIIGVLVRYLWIKMAG